MQILKFGGASLKNAINIKKVATIIDGMDYKDTIIIISAIGKTTNALETIVDLYLKKNNNLLNYINELHELHIKIIDDLFIENHEIYKIVSNDFQKIRDFLKNNKSPNYNFIYDQIIPFGELLASKIINEYFNSVNIKSEFKDVRKLIKTDSFYRNANINWELTQANILKTKFNPNISLTQGFISSNEDNFNTTMGRESSDYTASIFAYCLNAKSVTIWKDVDGIFNADPKKFKNTILLEKISYTEAIELAFYGASVILPKTLQPLQKKEIPLYVKSFLNPEGKGTSISRGTKIDPLIPCFIVQRNLNLLKLSSLDFSFIVEDNISDIFQILHENKMKVDLIQNSAISFSVCVYDKYSRLKELISILKATFKVECTENVSLFTIRHFNENSSGEILKNNTLLLEQRTKETLQLVVS